MDAAQILVIILAITLALFLLLSVVLVICLIKIARQISHVTESAERTVSSMENIASMVQKTVAPAVVTKMVSDIVARFTDKDKKSKD